MCGASLAKQPDVPDTVAKEPAHFELSRRRLTAFKRPSRAAAMLYVSSWPLTNVIRPRDLNVMDMHKNIGTPPSGEIKPNPRSALKNFTHQLGILISLPHLARKAHAAFGLGMLEHAVSASWQPGPLRCWRSAEHGGCRKRFGPRRVLVAQDPRRRWFGRAGPRHNAFARLLWRGFLKRLCHLPHSSSLRHRPGSSF
jgi:hypothetical protein